MRTDREGENEDRGDEEQGQPVQEPDSLVENAQLGIAIGPQHPDTSLSSPAGVGREEIESGARLFPRPFTHGERDLPHVLAVGAS
jgi:hypothetical protein